MKKMIKTLKDMDRVLLVVSIILFVFGLFNIVTASSQASVLRYHSSLYNYFYKQLLFILIGCLATLVILKLPTKSYYLFARVLFIFCIASCMLIPFIGGNYSGNRNWISIGKFLYQPSELAKVAVILYLAIYFEKYRLRLRENKKERWNYIAVIFFACIIFPIFILLTQRDLGTGILMTALVGLLFIASPISRMDKLRVIAFGMIGVLLCFFILVVTGNNPLSQSQNSRANFYDPCSRYEQGGYQVCNGFIAINAGGIKGVGIGKSRQKSYIPESHTDSVFAIIAEEYGLIITSLIFFAYIVILYRIMQLASLCKKVRGKYICYGVACYLFLHIVVNLGGVFGSMPLTGVPLPFLSYGGSYTISLMIALALVQRVHIEYKNEKIKI